MSKNFQYFIISSFIIIIILIICLTPDTRNTLSELITRKENDKSEYEVPHQDFPFLWPSIRPNTISEIGNETKNLNYRPIIGILSQELSRRMMHHFAEYNYTSYIAASYVKFVESAGARAVPIMIKKPSAYYEEMAKAVNGFLFPGGSLEFDSEYSKALQQILEISKRVGEKVGKALPIWATCLGFENVMYFESGDDIRTITSCNASNVANELVFSQDVSDSQLFGHISSDVLTSLSKEKITSNFHTKCVLPKNFHSVGLNESYRILSTSVDKEGVIYVSTIEHRLWPIFGTQWHPEKAPFEWADDASHSSIPHSLSAIQASQALAEVFVQRARENENSFENEEKETKNLIYNYSPVYVALTYNSSFQLCYFF